MEHIVNDIMDKVATKEPIYKITYILPSFINIGDDEDPMYNLDVDIKSVILNYSTYKENAYEIIEEVIDRNWKEIINKGVKTHRAIVLNEKEDENQTIFCRKLSVELIN